jgi:hypothetical protein
LFTTNDLLVPFNFDVSTPSGRIICTTPTKIVPMINAKITGSIGVSTDEPDNLL